MARLYSNELKALVVPENIFDNPINVLKEKCLTVQHFDYQCEHKRNALGEVYGPTEPVILKFTVRVNSPAHTRVFYNCLINNGYFDFSFLFNSTFGSNQRLSDCEDGMVVNAYVVSVEEHYSTEKNKSGEDQQILVDVTLLARSVIYMAREEQNNYKSVFVQ